MRTKRPTRQDVAAKAGVAPSTVTLILNERGADLGIPEPTRLRVQAAARELGYYPNWHIRSIRSGRTGNLGLYLRSDQWGQLYGYWSVVLGYLQRAVADADMRILIHCAPADCPTEEAFARQAGGVVDGVIILNSGNDPIAQRLTETGLPAVEIGDSYSPLPRVAVDGGAGVRMAVEHLRRRGYRNPAFCRNPSAYVFNDKEREQAFIEAVALHFDQGNAEERCLEVAIGTESFERLWRLSPRPDCVVCASDEQAYEILISARNAGVRVPSELALTGFDCIPTLSPSHVMTSVQTPLEQMAVEGVKKLVALVEGRCVEAVTTLPVGLRIGDTT